MLSERRPLAGERLFVGARDEGADVDGTALPGSWTGTIDSASSNILRQPLALLIEAAANVCGQVCGVLDGTANQTPLSWCSLKHSSTRESSETLCSPMVSFLCGVAKHEDVEVAILLVKRREAERGRSVLVAPSVVLGPRELSSSPTTRPSLSPRLMRGSVKMP